MLLCLAPVKAAEAEASWSIWKGNETYFAVSMSAATRAQNPTQGLGAAARCASSAEAIASQHSVSQKRALSRNSSVAVQL